MEHILEYRYFKFNEDPDDIKDPTEPFFMGNKKRSHKRSHKEYKKLERESEDVNVMDVSDLLHYKEKDRKLKEYFGITYDELKEVLNSQLAKYNKIFNPIKKPNENLNLLRGTYIIGPYSSGKSHVALFLSLLLGLDVNFQNSNRHNEIPNIRKRCWEILEENFSLTEMMKFNNLKEGNFLVLNFSFNSFEIMPLFKTFSNFASMLNKYRTFNLQYLLNNRVSNFATHFFPKFLILCL